MVCLVPTNIQHLKMTACRCQESDPMKNYEMASYANLLPAEERDRFAGFALRAGADRVRNFVRYQLQMRRRGFTPVAAPKHW